MSKYPRTTRFFINSWTWGYEDVLKEIAKAFGVKVSFVVFGGNTLLTPFA